MDNVFKVLLVTSFLISCTSANKNQNSKKNVDVDKIACSWNKGSKESEEKCKPDPNKKGIGEKLDTRLTKDAKKIKKFFGIEKDKKKDN